MKCCVKADAQVCMIGGFQAVLAPMHEMCGGVQGSVAGDGECGDQGAPLPVQA